MITHHWSHDHEDWLRSRLPAETGSDAIYIRSRSEFPGLVEVPGALLYTTRTLSAKLRQWLEPKGAWHGAGFAMVIETEDLWHSLPWRRQQAHILHEMAHLFEFRAAGKFDATFVWDETWTALELSYDHKADIAASSVNVHGYRFARAALHLWWRCRLDVDLGTMQIFTDDYDSPNASSAITALEDELRSTTDIMSVLKTPAPEAFDELWLPATT